MSGNCVDERPSLVVVLSYGSCRLEKTSSFGYKSPLLCLIRKVDSLDRSGD